MTIGIYQIQNLRNQKLYVGGSIEIEKRFDRHRRELNQGIHHCTPLQNDWNKFGSKAFNFQIVKKCSDKNEVIKEEQWQLDYFHQTFPDRIYNMSRHATCGDLISYHPKRDEIVAKMTKSLKKRYDLMTEEERKTVYGQNRKNNPMFGRNHTEEAKQKMSAIHKGNSYAKGNKWTPEQRAKLSKIASQRTGEKNPFYGKKHSKETREKLSSQKKGKLPNNTKPVIIDNILYESATFAAKELGVATATITNRIKSDKFPTYKFLET